MIGKRPTPAAVGVASAALVVASGGAFSPTARMWAGALFAAVAGWGWVRGKGKLLLEERLGLTFVAWAVVSFVVNPGNPLAAKEMLVDWLVALGLFVIVRRAGDRDRTFAVWCSACAALIVAASIIGQSALSASLRVGGLYINPNVAVALMVPVIPVLFVVPWRRRRWWIAAAAVVICAGVVMTTSRAGLLALVAVLTIMMPNRRFKVAAVIIAGTAAVALGVWRFVLSPDPLAWHRLEIWRAVSRLLISHPVFGVGPGSLEEATGVVRIAHPTSFAVHRHIIGSAESSVLSVAVRTGWIGLGILLSALAALVRREVRDGGLSSPAAWGALGAVGVVAAFHDVADQGVVLWWWAVLLGIVLPAAEPVILQRPPLAARSLVGTAMIGIVLWGMVQPSLARRQWRREPPTPATAEMALRAEPWLAEAAEWRVEHLLERPGWTWDDAATALAWSGRAVRIHAGSIHTWSLYGQVNARIALDLGGWPDVVAETRRGYRTATDLEPYLPWHWFRWAQFERGMGSLGDAAALAERSVAVEPNFVRGWLFLARVRADQGDLEAARQARDRALAAEQRSRGRRLSGYEADLARTPRWQVEELGVVLD
jgi:O-antigen ligase